jgi:hypothetical protein
MHIVGDFIGHGASKLVAVSHADNNRKGSIRKLLAQNERRMLD